MKVSSGDAFLLLFLSFFSSRLVSNSSSQILILCGNIHSGLCANMPCFGSNRTLQLHPSGCKCPAVSITQEDPLPSLIPSVKLQVSWKEWEWGERQRMMWKHHLCCFWWAVKTTRTMYKSISWTDCQRAELGTWKLLPKRMATCSSSSEINEKKDTFAKAYLYAGMHASFSFLQDSRGGRILFCFLNLYPTCLRYHVIKDDSMCLCLFKSKKGYLYPYLYWKPVTGWCTTRTRYLSWRSVILIDQVEVKCNPPSSHFILRRHKLCRYFFL